jgi:hypothetical protein
MSRENVEVARRTFEAWNTGSGRAIPDHANAHEAAGLSKVALDAGSLP